MDILDAVYLEVFVPLAKLKLGQEPVNDNTLVKVGKVLLEECYKKFNKTLSTDDNKFIEGMIRDIQYVNKQQFLNRFSNK